jgi:nucleoside 2-deoxyribosyltransferase
VKNTFLQIEEYKMSQPKVYLCGPISGLTIEECTAERERVMLQLAACGIEAYSPLRGKKHLVPSGQIIGSGAYDAVIGRANGIIGRDRNDVLRCDALLADLRGAKKASIGSMVEFGWADAWRKPIVTVMEKGNVHDHVFVNHLSTYVTHSIDDAVNLLSLLLCRQ